jgi:acetyl-CoA carboxylase biotin carboxyl carrier protein
VQHLGEDVAASVDPPATLDELRADAAGLAASEEELLLLALYGDDAEPLLRSVRGRGRRDESEATGLSVSESERLREVIRVVQESGIAEVTIEEGEMRITVRRTDEQRGEATVASFVPTAPVHEEPGGAVAPAASDVIRVESPMVGTFYRAPQPGSPPFVEEGDTVELGQTLCILEAMKLMNVVKAENEAVVRRICVGYAESVEYGQLLFELEPLNGRPLDAL